jgi:hypothetical protein
MTDDGRVLGLLTEVLDGFPTSAPDRLLASVLDGVRTVPQRRRWRSIRGWLRFIPDPLTRQPAAGSLLVVVVAVVAIAFLQLVPTRGPSGPGVPSPSASPSRSASPSLSPSPSTTRRRSAFDDTQIAIEKSGTAGLVSGVAYTSSAFKPQVAFRLGSRLGQETGQETNWCSPRGSDAPTPYTSPRTIVLAWREGCVSDLRIIRPFAVDCGTPDSHPDAIELAAAILARTGMGVIHDLGTLQTPGAVPSTLFFGPYQGRVSKIFRSRDVDPNATDPEGCRLMPESGTNDPTIEIRGDLTETLVLLDVGRELVVVRAGSAGFDGPTGAAGEARGYGNADVLDAMLSGIYDLEFR